MTQAVVAVVASLCIAVASYSSRALTASGAVMAFAVGAVIFGIGGWRAAAVLLAFFVSSSLLSRLGSRRKHALVDWGKQGARDAAQVFANGGVATLCIVFGALYPALRVPLFLGFAGSLAAATADTWSTEIGTLGGTPRSILTFRPVERGFSGGVTLVGTIASILGAAFVAATAFGSRVAPFLPVLAAGFAGGLFDSILGASVQGLRWCPHCDRACEMNPHACGNATTLLRGAAWMNNDAVNFLATVCGACVAVLVASR